jgi:ribosomal protein S16
MCSFGKFTWYHFCLQLGTFNPIPSKDGTKEIRVNVERARYWVSVGAQPSERVRWLFGKMGVLPPAPIRQSNPAAFGIPKAVFKEQTKAKEDLRAEHAKKAKKLLEDRKKAKLARRKERREAKLAAKAKGAKTATTAAA